MIDLHTHSLVSDGTDTPAELVAAAARAGLTTVAITDHDTADGWAEAAQAAQEHGIALVRGAELSTLHDGRSVHLLAYLHDPEHEELQSLLARVVDDRMPRLRAMVDLMIEDGVDITWESVAEIAEVGTTPGRPHIADALVARGVVGHRNEAFDRWLHNGSRYYVRHFSLETSQAVRLVREAGGVPVVAHPFATKRGPLTADAVRELAAAGLLGIEVDHRDHDDDARALAASLATELDLIPTGSSDYHGTGKHNLLGENTTAPESLARIEAAATSKITVLR